MSTRATVHFRKDGHTAAIVYRHGDGYPKGLGADLATFFQEVKRQTKDTRFSDPSYLAAKWVVYDALEYAGRRGSEERIPLDFLSVGIVQQDPFDIDYRYLVECVSSSEEPKILVQQL